MTSKERFTRMYEHKDADRVPILDWAWNETVERWQKEGMPTSDYKTYFGFDDCWEIGTNNSPNLPCEVISEDEDSCVYTTSWGATMRSFKKVTTTPQHIGYSVNTPDAWRKIKDRFAPSKDRVDWEALKRYYKPLREKGGWITGGLWFGFDITHSGMVGTEEMLVAMLEEPEWAMEMFETELNLSIANLTMIMDAGYTFDEIMWYDDMGYKGTQFFSRKIYREVLKPFHQKAIDWGHSIGCKVRLHSCGNIMPLVPELIDMGLDGLNPIEVKAGMDPVKLKEDFGDKLVLHGGINAVNWDKPDIIIPEIERVVPRLKQNGGYIFASDHSIPSTVSFSDFSRIMEALKKAGTY